jgi:pSer/pThr/pTyr-binding forkhead associated (FHA) protein
LFSVILLILRYAFLLLLFVFIIKLVKWMVGDLINDKGQLPEGLKELTERRDDKESAGGLLTVINSSLPDLKQGDSFGIDRDIVLGRGGSSDIVIRDTYTSSYHARVFMKKGQYWLADLDSTNGTFLNEVQVKQPIILADGDRLRVGGVTFQFVRCGHEVGVHN